MLQQAEIKYVLLKGHGSQAMAFLLPRYPHIVDHPQFHPRNNHGDRNGGHLTGCGGLISVPVVQEVSVVTKQED